METTEPTEIDLYDPRSFVDGVPHGAMARLREATPVFRHPERAMLGWPEGPGFWAVLRYADVVHVNRHPEIFSSHVGATQIRDPAPEDLPFVQQMILNMDPPDHTVMRRVVQRGFTPRRMEAMRDDLARRATMLVDRVIEAGECDFVRDLSADMPLMTLAELMGVPLEDRGLMKGWADRIIGYQDEEYAAGSAAEQAGPQKVNPRSREALSDMFEYAHALAEEKLAHPGDDLLTMVLTADVDGEKLSVEQFENFFFLLAVAGNETLRNGIPGGMWALMEHPDQRLRLLDDPSLLGSAIDEMLRYHSPVVHFRRTATRATELGGRRIAAGEKVVVFYAAANRDPEEFPDPDRFDIARTPNRHLAFGSGPHVCLGARLARMQMEAMFSEILSRMPDIEPAGDPVRLGSSFQAGFKRMPVSYTPGPTVLG